LIRLDANFDHLVKKTGYLSLVSRLGGMANDYFNEFPPLFAIYVAYFLQKADKNEKKWRQGRQ